MWVIVVLLLLGGTIVCVRLFRNGALEEAELEASESPAPESIEPPVAPVKTRARATRAQKEAVAEGESPPPSAAATAARSRRTKVQASAAPAAAWPGGDCPACGNPTVPAAKFCGECGHRLTS